MRSNSDSSGRIPELDGIRGLAILLVLLWHYVGDPLQQATDPGGSLISFGLGLAWSGVDLFFVLSGFLIGGILMDNRDSPNYFKAFYARRVCRIVPIYFVWLIAFAVLAFIVPALLSNVTINRLFTQPQPMWTYFTFTQNISMAITNEYGAPWLSVTWSLAIEEQFYLILPLLIHFTAPRRLPQLLLGAIVAAPVLRIVAYVTSGLSEVPPYVLMPCRMDALLLGALSAYVIRRPRFKRWIARHTRWLYGALSILLVSTLFLRVAPSQGDVVVWGYSLLAALYTCVLLIAVTEHRGLVTGIVRNRALRRLGVIAYGTYLFHQAINGVLHGLILHQAPRLVSLSDWAVTLGAFSATIIIAQISWTYFEKRLVMLGQRVRYIPAPILGASGTLTTTHAGDRLIRTIDRGEGKHADES